MKTLRLLTFAAVLLALFSACKEDTSAGLNDDGSLCGVFAVSDSTWVAFSRGNLQYQPSSATWRFAESQKETLGRDNENISSSYTGWIDLFGWGTSGWGSGAEAYMPYSTSTLSTNYMPGGDTSANLTGIYANADWGQYNPIENGGKTPGRWRTLSKDEWTYLLNQRQGASQKYGLAKIDNVQGLVLLPEGWTLPDGMEFTPGFENGYKTNRYTGAKWSKMQSAGAVFLPAAGYSEEYTVFTKFQGDDGCGFYWSSTSLSAPNCNILFFGKSAVNPNNFSKRHFGLAVRLVTPTYLLD